MSDKSNPSQNQANNTVQNSENNTVINRGEKETESCKIGLMGIGLDTYWEQFEGLRDRLIGYQNEIENTLLNWDVQVVNAGLVDSPEKANQANRMFQEAGISLLFIYVSTYALSSTVLPAVRNLNIPVVVLNLQPTAAIDYKTFNQMGDRTKMTGEWLAHCQSCSVPEIANVFLRSGIPFHQVTGVLRNDEIAWSNIYSWVKAAQTVCSLRKTRIGLLGHYYNGMLDIYSDLTSLASTFGVHFEIVEMSGLHALRRNISNSELARKIETINKHFDVQPDCLPEEIVRAAETSIALDRLVEQNSLGALAYFYNGTGNDADVDLISSVIVGNSLLTASGVPVAGEYEVKNVLAMKILDLLNAGGSFSEFYAVDFDDDIVLLGHDGPAHTVIGEGKTKLKPLDVYHGKVGKGLSVEMSVKNGPVTLLSVVDAPFPNQFSEYNNSLGNNESRGTFSENVLQGNSLANGFGKVIGNGSRNCGARQFTSSSPRFLVAEGESVPGEILQIGNTNSRYRFSCGARNFIDSWVSQGPAHHCAIGVGRQTETLARIAMILGTGMFRVC